MDEHLSKELENGKEPGLYAIHTNPFTASQGVSDELTKKLRQLYWEHQHRQQRVSNKIKAFDITKKSSTRLIGKS